jgi:hypothetical protein
MGDVIEGPWMRRDVPELVSHLDQELRRMTVALEKLREDRATEIAAVGQSQSLSKNGRIAADLA